MQMQGQVGWKQNPSVNTAPHSLAGSTQLLGSPEPGQPGHRGNVGNSEHLLLTGARSLELPMDSGSSRRAWKTEGSPRLLSAAEKIQEELGDQGHQENQPENGRAWSQSLPSPPLCAEKNHRELPGHPRKRK